MRSLLVIPAMAVVAAIVAVALGASVVAAGLAAAAGAALAHAVRALASDAAPAVIVGAVVASQLAIASTIEHAGIDLAWAWLALAATAWAIAELARPDAEPLVAMLPAVIAAVIEPGCTPLCALAGARVASRRARSNAVVAEPARGNRSGGVVAEPARGGRSGAARGAAAGLRTRLRGAHTQTKRRVGALTRTRWIVTLPIAGCIGVVLAIVVGAAGEGALAALAARWYPEGTCSPCGSLAYGTQPHAVGPPASLAALAEALGPIAAVAALAGLAVMARGPSRATVAVGACIAGALLVDLRAGAPSPQTLGLAALCAGVAVARFAGTIRIAAGQALAGATCAVMLLVPPAWAIALALG